LGLRLNGAIYIDQVWVRACCLIQGEYKFVRERKSTAPPPMYILFVPLCELFEELPGELVGEGAGGARVAGRGGVVAVSSQHISPQDFFHKAGTYPSKATNVVG
jgi:hypothetical protein